MQNVGVCELNILSMVNGLENKLLLSQHSTSTCNCMFDSWKWNRCETTLRFGMSFNQPIILGPNIPHIHFLSDID